MNAAEMRSRLACYGADLEGIEDRFMGDMELYETCLHLFCDDKHFGQMENAFAEGNVQAAFSAAHALKGVAGNLGLTPLYVTMCGVVETLRYAKSCEGISEKMAEIALQRERMRELL